jgi:hypothetical protein
VNHPSSFKGPIGDPGAAIAFEPTLKVKILYLVSDHRHLLAAGESLPKWANRKFRDKFIELVEKHKDGMYTRLRPGIAGNYLDTWITANLSGAMGIQKGWFPKIDCEAPAAPPPPVAKDVTKLSTALMTRIMFMFQLRNNPDFQAFAQQFADPSGAPLLQLQEGAADSFQDEAASAELGDGDDEDNDAVEEESDEEEEDAEEEENDGEENDDDQSRAGASDQAPQPPPASSGPRRWCPPGPLRRTASKRSRSP